MKIVAISDTHHSFHRPEDMPEGDVLIHAGDFTNMGYQHEIIAFAKWCGDISYKYDQILVIAGNHDLMFEEHLMKARGNLRKHGPHNLTYLQDQTFVYHNLEEDKEYRFYGTPWQPVYKNWAFNLPRGPLLAEKWMNVPANTDVLVTHCGPRGILDPGNGEEHCGCDDLLDWVTKHIRPRVHIFGHYHSGYGRVERDGILYVNAASCDETHFLDNPPQVIEL